MMKDQVAGLESSVVLWLLLCWIMASRLSSRFDISSTEPCQLNIQTRTVFYTLLAIISEEIVKNLVVN